MLTRRKSDPGAATRRARDDDFEVARRFGVRVESGPEAGLELVASSEELTIGTEPGNGLRLADPTVSRHQCVIRSRKDGVTLHDLGSTNGTRLGAHRILAAYLRSGDRIQIGGTVLRFVALPDFFREEVCEHEALGPLVGRSPAMRHLFARLERFARTDATVLIEGETGTGKGLVASTLHERSARASGPFVVVDCATLSAALVESELFGHERGAFTGATQSRAGAAERAAGGTLFIDEIGELPLELQPKFLRLLDGGTVRRVGGGESFVPDARVIAATNRDLCQEMARGAFRPDLYHRLSVLRLHLPPLRERPEDLEPLLTRLYQDATGTPGARPPHALLEAARQRPWRGNVRELRNAVERWIVLGTIDAGAIVRPFGEAAPGSVDTPSPLEDRSFRDAKDEAIARWERGFLERLLERHHGNLLAAARGADMDRNHLRHLLGAHRLRARGG